MKSGIFKICFAFLTLFAIYSCQPEEENQTPAPTDSKSKCIGSWTCQETSGLNPGNPYTVHIIDSVGTAFVSIENLYSSGFQTKVKASVSGSALTIANQPLGTGGYTIYGTGNLLSNTSISLSFSVNDGSTIDNVTANLTKQ